MSNSSITIDGSQGEGGGQVVRSSLALSLLTQRPIRIENVRGKRKKPGLKNQHVTCVNAAMQIGGSSCEGGEVGSSFLAFQPGEVTAGEYAFRIQTAGSSTLVLQTVLPSLMVAGGPSVVRVSGGTHNPLAPTFDFLQQAYAPLVRKLGPNIELELSRHGFYPAGGGEFTCQITPAESLRGVEILERGKTIRRYGKAIVANLPLKIAEREVSVLQRKSNWPADCFESVEVDSNGPGNVVTIGLENEHANEICVGFGSRGVPAERVANNAWREMKRYEKSNVPIGEYLADQIILPMAMAAHFDKQASSFRTVQLSQHTKTHIDLLERFLDVKIEVEETDGEGVLVRVTG